MRRAVLPVSSHTQLVLQQLSLPALDARGVLPGQRPGGGAPAALSHRSRIPGQADRPGSRLPLPQAREDSGMTDRDDWLKWRRDGIGASDIAALMGISPWASPWSVWADKSGLLPPEPENEYMAAGRWLEAAIAPWFTDITGLHVTGEQMWCTHPGKPWARCTPDGFIVEKAENEYETERAWSYALEHALAAFEVKVTGPGRRWDPI